MTDINNIKIDLNMAEDFLHQLDQDAEQFCFQLFGEKNKSLPARLLYGSLSEHSDELVAYNQQGGGVFVTINETDGMGRKAENIVAVRACFVDLDGAPLNSLSEAPCAPDIVVNSSSGRYHAYWLVKNIRLEDFRSVQKKLASACNGDPSVCDLPRVMRLPGFFHNKRNPQLVTILRGSHAIH